MVQSVNISDFAADVNVFLSPEGRRKDLKAFAAKSLSEVQEINKRVLGKEPAYTKSEGKNWVKFEFIFTDVEMLRWISSMLLIHSPHGETGVYAESHIVMADNATIDISGDVPIAAIYIFANTAPFSRKIERGLSPQRPDGVYQAVAVLAQQRYPEAKVTFGYLSLEGVAYQYGVEDPEWLKLQPAIYVVAA